MSAELVIGGLAAAALFSGGGGLFGGGCDTQCAPACVPQQQCYTYQASYASPCSGYSYGQGGYGHYTSGYSYGRTAYAGYGGYHGW